jgi:hypothetical protein
MLGINVAEGLTTGEVAAQFADVYQQRLDVCAVFADRLQPSDVVAVGEPVV